MEKYKICPVCGLHNQPTMLECMECETDLSGERVIGKESEVPPTEEPAPTGQSGVMVRICDCGEKNPAQVRKCQKCGEDISMVPMIFADDSQAEPHPFVLVSVDGTEQFEVREESTVIGREYMLKEYLETKLYVSRRHVELRWKEDKLFIKNFSTTNFTFINNVKIKNDEFIELQDGDEIGLGGISQNGSRQPEVAYFIVRGGSCT